MLRVVECPVCGDLHPVEEGTHRIIRCDRLPGGKTQDISSVRPRAVIHCVPDEPKEV